MAISILKNDTFPPCPVSLWKTQKTFSGKENVRFRFRPRRRTLWNSAACSWNIQNISASKKSPTGTFQKHHSPKSGETLQNSSPRSWVLSRTNSCPDSSRRNHEKKSQGVCQNPRVEKSQGKWSWNFQPHHRHDGNDYEHLEDFLIDDFKHFSLTFNDLRLNRKKFLNFHQVLFALLKKNGFNPNEDDFKLLVLRQEGGTRKNSSRSFQKK